MPYRLRKINGQYCVQVKRTTRWQSLKCYAGAGALKKAAAYLGALNKNVDHK